MKVCLLVELGSQWSIGVNLSGRDWETDSLTVPLIKIRNVEGVDLWMKIV